MISKRRIGHILILAILFFSHLCIAGCATSRNHMKGPVAVDYRHLRGLDDSAALNRVAEIYNTPVETKAEEVAKNLALEDFIEELKSRRSEVIEQSGIFDVQYERIELKNWRDEDLVETFEVLQSRAKMHDARPVSRLTHKEKIIRIIHVKGMDSIYDEFKKRDTTKNVLSFLGQVLGVALSVAAGMV